jgi:hypothetical protein
MNIHFVLLGKVLEDYIWSCYFTVLFDFIVVVWFCHAAITYEMFMLGNSTPFSLEVL